MFSGKLRDELFGKVDPLGKTLTVDAFSYLVVGVLGGPSSEDLNRSIFVPLSLATQHLAKVREFVRINIRIDLISNTRPARKQILGLLKQLHRSPTHGIMVQHHAARLDRIEKIILLVQLFSYGAILTVFVLGKVGLTNVMMEAVKNRTREIGLRKALGSTNALIRAQFVLESFLVSLIGGGTGVLAGLGVILLLSKVMGLPVTFHGVSTNITVDILITVAIGIWAGAHPSGQASRLDITQAMSFE